MYAYFKYAGARFLQRRIKVFRTVEESEREDVLSDSDMKEGQGGVKKKINEKGIQI